MVLLDSSGSIGYENYEKAKSFVDKLTAAFAVQNGIRKSFIVFSDVASTIVTLKNTLTPAELSLSILGAPYLRHTTNTYLGINAAIDEFNSSPRLVPLNLVVITDGVSTNPSLTIAAANTTASMGVRAFSVGIGNSINQQELRDIAGGNGSRVYTTNDYDELSEVLNPLSLQVCENESLPPLGPTTTSPTTIATTEPRRYFLFLITNKISSCSTFISESILSTKSFRNTMVLFRSNFWKTVCPNLGAC